LFIIYFLYNNNVTEPIRIAYATAIQENLEQVTEQHLDQRVERLKTGIVEAMKQMVPEKIKPNKLWISDNTPQLAKEKRQLKQRRRQSDAMRQQYKQKCRETRSAPRRDKQIWIEMQCQQMEHCASNGRSKETFRLVKKLFQPRQLAIKDNSGKLLSTKDEVIGRWTEYCSELYKGKQDCSTTVTDLISIAPPLREDGEMDILFEEVQAAIDRL